MSEKAIGYFNCIQIKLYRLQSNTTLELKHNKGVDCGIWTKHRAPPTSKAVCNNFKALPALRSIPKRVLFAYLGLKIEAPNQTEGDMSIPYGHSFNVSHRMISSAWTVSGFLCVTNFSACLQKWINVACLYR